ncbi:MAG: hypothetical protein ABSA53_34850, partial [Streptosporangiaceae bacterium]
MEPQINPFCAASFILPRRACKNTEWQLLPWRFGCRLGQRHGHDAYVLLGGFCREVDPAPVLVAGDLNGDGAGGWVAGCAARARRDQVVDVAGDN